MDGGDDETKFDSGYETPLAEDSGNDSDAESAEVEHQVERVLNKKTVKGKLYYLVLWRGIAGKMHLGNQRPTWMGADNW